MTLIRCTGVFWHSVQSVSLLTITATVALLPTLPATVATGPATGAVYRCRLPAPALCPTLLLSEQLITGSLSASRPWQSRFVHIPSTFVWTALMCRAVFIKIYLIGHHFVLIGIMVIILYFIVISLAVY